MEKRIHPILLYLLLSNILSSAAHTIPIRVDMDEYEDMTFNRLSMALSDLYSAHQHYKTSPLLEHRHTTMSMNSSDLEGFRAWDEAFAFSLCAFRHGVWGLGYWTEENEIVKLKSKLASITMAALPYGVPYEYIDLTYQVYLGQYDIAAADTIVDFTLSYTGQRVISICSFFFIVFFIWILENQNLKGFWYQVGMTFWCAFSTVVFAHKERAVRHLSRLVLIIWFLAVLILTQSYAASLASMLTVQKLQPTVTDVDLLIGNSEIYIGYMQGSFVFGLLKGMHFDESRLVEYESPEKLDELLSDGSIAAAFHETPNVKLFLGKYCSKYTTIGPINKATGFGIVFVIGSDLVTDVSCEVLDMTEGQKMAEIERKWLGDVMNKCLEYSNINNLGPASFWGLFLIVGMTALIIYVVRCE